MTSIVSPAPPHTIPAAMEEWLAAVGEAHVIQCPQSLRQAETATFATRSVIPLILRPGSREEVQACLRIANRHRIPVYPVSSGKNWGYGSRVPPASGCVVLDLGRMNRIVDFSEDLAYVTVEPGVTQRQLREFLAERRSELWMDATGSSPECSLIGNAMERGFGHTPYGDHFAHACGLEVVLPDGECIDTGFARFDSPASPVYRWGLGPSLDGLFSQSNFGIVTRMTIWLMPAPERFQAFFFRCDSEEDFAAAMDSLRVLKLNGTLRSVAHIANDYKVLGGMRQYPWAEMGGSTPLDPENMRQFRKRFSLGVWNGSGGLYGTRGQVRDARRQLRRALKGKVSRLEFVDDRKLALAETVAPVYRLITGWDLTRALELVRPLFGLLKGQPTMQPLASSYWRKRSAPPPEMDPDRDGCGLLWCAPVAPFEGRHARRLSDIATQTLLEHGFEPMISISLVTERAIACVISITYDRHVPGEDERALRCYRALERALTEHGYYSYRTGVQSMAQMEAPRSYSQLLLTLKQAVDPNHILAPGRYQAAGRSSLANQPAV